MNNVEIYYFSGTGNSLHIAKELQGLIPETKLIPIVSLLDQTTIETNAEKIGFVFPTYLTTVPAPVRVFIDKLDLRSSKYIFSITTRIGTMCVSNTFIKKALKKKGKNLDSSFIINMANNSPTGLKPFGDKNWPSKITKEKIAELEYEAQLKLKFIKECIINTKKHLEEENFVTSIMEKVMSLMTKNIKSEIAFCADLSCNGCGVCEKICLSKKIEMVDNRPIWKKEAQCYFCYACFNFCPMQSIMVGKLYSYKNGRYSYPGITADEIEKQKFKG
ncbi:MAG: EFR1 family ferrodoxin [Eubacteriales bacterium]|nr:EFR1 family ferrodoxin [Eubacteriales bacterium]